jgi:hypothetical protein
MAHEPGRHPCDRRQDVRMAIPKETKRQEYERHAHECLDLVKHSTNAKTRATLIAMAEAWMKLAEEAAPGVSKVVGRSKNPFNRVDDND